MLTLIELFPDSHGHRDMVIALPSSMMHMPTFSSSVPRGLTLTKCVFHLSLLLSG